MRNKLLATGFAVATAIGGYFVNAYADNKLITPAKQAKEDTSKRPILTTAGIVHYCPEDKIILIERGKAPFGFAMFGGHVEYESPENAFKREAKEELNVDVENLELVGVYGEPGRDPRQHSVEVTYSATTNQEPYAGSDAKKSHLFAKEELKRKLDTEPQAFAFDHADILKKYLSKDCNPCKKSISR
ncbi:MAG: NUDIX domain-containing protein [Alphaproteobacteria bacterium]